MARRMLHKYVLVIFCCLLHLGTQEKLDNSLPKLTGDEGNVKKSATIYDYHTRMSAYKDLVGSGCYIEFIKNGETSLSQKIREFPLMKLPSKLYISKENLSKRRIWDLAGSRIWEFCRGFPTYLIQEVQNKDSNDIYTDNDIIKSRLRRKRSTRHYFVGRLRGQTQSQYLNFGHSNNSSGKAEAESTYGTSRATVVGSNGMGQAQSQSSPYDCDECYRPIKTEYRPGSRSEMPFGTEDRGSNQEPGDLTSGTPGTRVTRPNAFGPRKVAGSQQSELSYPSQSGYPGTGGGIYPERTIPRRPGVAIQGGPGNQEFPGKAEGGFSEIPVGEKYPISSPGRPGSGEIYGAIPVRLPGQSGGATPSSPAFPSTPEQRYPTSDGKTYPVSLPEEQRRYYPGATDTQRPGGIKTERPSNGAVTPDISVRYPDGDTTVGQTRPRYPPGRPQTGTLNSNYPIGTNEQNPDRNIQEAEQGQPVNVPSHPTIPNYPTSPPSVALPPIASYPNLQPPEYPSVQPYYPGTNFQPGRPPGTSYPKPGQGATPDVSGSSQYLQPGVNDKTQRYPGDTFKPSPDVTGTHGTFDGNIGGDYNTVGHTGRFSGQFSGVFDVNGHQIPQSQPLYPVQGHPSRPTPVQYPGYYPTTGPELQIPPIGPLGTHPTSSKPNIQLTKPGNQKRPSVKEPYPGYQKPGKPIGPPRQTHISNYQPSGVPTMPNQYPSGETQYQPGMNTGPWQIQPGAGQGPFQPGVSTGQGQYQPVSIGQGNYAPGVSTGQDPYRPGTTVEQGQYTPQQPGTDSGQNQYRPGFSGRQQFQPGFTPGQAPYKPGINTEQGQYQPGVGTGQGSYQPGTVQYQPAQNIDQGKFHPGSVTGHEQYPQSVDSGQGPYTQGADRDQYQPGAGTGQGQYTTGTGVGQGQISTDVVTGQGQYTPGVGNGHGQYTPGVGTVQGQYTPAVGTGQGQYTPGQVQYTPGPVQYTPGQVQYIPGQVQYKPGVGTRPGAGTGSAQYEPGSGTSHGHYTPGVGTGQEQYIPGAGTRPGQYIPGAGVGSGQYRPGAGIGQGQYIPGAGIGQGQFIPGANNGQGQYTPDQGTGHVPGGTIESGQPKPSIITGQGQYPLGTSSSQQGGTNEQGQQGAISSNQPNIDVSSKPLENAYNDGDSQVQTSVQQMNNETQASAQAQGKFQSGTAQSQVSGTYSGTGSFSASAGSDDGKRGALTQVSGGKQGATSSAQGRGGKGTSQAQMQLFSDTGRILSTAQSGGTSHGSQTQVQGGEEGGMANAQSNGSGRTSSQAQIGFAPYKKITNELDSQNNFFLGGGTASAQGGSSFGQSQSQIQGKFRYGIKYTGGAQAQSGNGINRNFSFLPFEPRFQIKPVNLISQSLAKNEETKSTVAVTETSSIPSTEKNENKISSTTDEDISTVEPSTEGGDSVEYDYEDNETENPTTNKVITQTRNGQTQHIVLPHMRNLDANVVQSHFDDYQERVFQPGDTFQPGELIPGTSGYRIPVGFRAKVKSVASPSQTYALGRNSQAQTVTITPGTGKIIYQKPKTFNNYYDGYRSSYTYKPYQNYFRSGENTFPNFLSISKSETGYENPITGKRVSSTHFTQSSTCGLITNTCIFRKTQRICLPNITRKPDGSIRVC